MSASTVHEATDTNTVPFLVVRTRVLQMPVEDILAALVAAIMDHPSMDDLRDEQVYPEPVLEARLAVDLADADRLAAKMTAAHPEVPARQRIKIVRRAQ